MLEFESLGSLGCAASGRQTSRCLNRINYNTTFKLSNLRTLELDSLLRTPAPSTSEFDRLSKLEVRRVDRLEFESSTGV